MTKHKTCKNRECKKKFIPARQMQVVCGPYCARLYASQQAEKKREVQAKQDRREHRDKKESIKPRHQLVKEAQREFNRFIRLRDHDQPCISCGAVSYTHLTLPTKA